MLARDLGFSGDKTTEMVRQFDVNFDGRLSYNEFVAFYCKFEERSVFSLLYKPVNSDHISQVPL